MNRRGFFGTLGALVVGGAIAPKAAPTPTREDFHPVKTMVEAVIRRVVTEGGRFEVQASPEMVLAYQRWVVAERRFFNSMIRPDGKPAVVMEYGIQLIAAKSMTGMSWLMVSTEWPTITYKGKPLIADRETPEGTLFFLSPEEERRFVWRAFEGAQG
jgi:hypothetical protein